MPKITPTIKADPVGSLRDEAAEQAARIQSQYKMKEPPVKKGQVAPVQTMRERILSLSLFPNTFNRSNVMRYSN